MKVVKSIKKQPVPPQLVGKGFKKGQSGNPKGRPVGSISIMGRIKQIWQDNPEEFEDWIKNVMKDKMLRRELIQQVDGKPVERVEMSGKDGGAIEIISFRDDNTDK